MDHLPLSEKEEMIAKHIVDAAFKVHKNLGAGLIEKVYEACFCHELSKTGNTASKTGNSADRI
jgi:GxxExxY protein